jgi:sec-independent protein translocase protein TatC
MYEFFSFMLRVVVPIGFLFELPIIITFLTQISIISPIMLRKHRRYAYLIVVILSAMFTPPDFVSNILLAIVLILLYEGSIWLSDQVYRRTNSR